MLRRVVQRNDAKIIAVDPWHIGLVEDAALGALAPRYGVGAHQRHDPVILKEGLQDQTFIDVRTESFEALKNR
jgi:predicted molibdopterin-dependent oxidoreductase YjgC